MTWSLLVKPLYSILLIIIPFAIASAHPFEGIPEFRNIVVTPITIQQDGVTIHGYRFQKKGTQENKSQTPILFTHGLSSNLHEFTPMIPLYVNAGQDCFAFNFRGHGNDSERSTVSRYREGDYAFDKLAHIDFPLIVSEVQKYHPGPINLIGHSMGGMVPRAALHDGIIASREIKAMVLIGSPASFHSTMTWTKHVGMQKALRMYLNMGSGEGAAINVSKILHLSSLIEKVKVLKPFYAIQKAMAEKAIQFVLENEFGARIYESEHNQQLQRALSKQTPKDIFRSFSDFQRVGYPYENVPIDVPILHVVGEKDSLAPPQTIIESAQVQSRKTGFRVIGVNGINHFGIVSSWVASEYLAETLSFLRDPITENGSLIHDLSGRQTVIRISAQKTCSSFYR